MSQLIIRGAHIQSYEVYCASNGQFTIEAKIRANWSDTVCREMKWTEEPQGFGNGSLDGGLAGISMILEPNKQVLKDYRLDVGISKVSKFKHVAKIKDGKVEGRELEFVVTTVADDAGAVLENYVRHCNPGDDRGQCRITYNAKEQKKLDDKQDNLLGTEPEAEMKTRGRRKAAEAVQ